MPDEQVKGTGVRDRRANPRIELLTMKRYRERQYQEAQVRFLAHKKQKAEAKAADAAGAAAAETTVEESAE